MAIDRNTGEEITLKEAIDFTHAFQTNNPEELKSFFVGINKLNLILEQENCVGLRIYNGYNIETRKKNLVLVGVNQEGEDMTNGMRLENLKDCPPAREEKRLIFKK